MTPPPFGTFPKIHPIWWRHPSLIAGWMEWFLLQACHELSQPNWPGTVRVFADGAFMAAFWEQRQIFSFWVAPTRASKKTKERQVRNTFYTLISLFIWDLCNSSLKPLSQLQPRGARYFPGPGDLQVEVAQWVLHRGRGWRPNHGLEHTLLRDREKLDWHIGRASSVGEKVLGRS